MPVHSDSYGHMEHETKNSERLTIFIAAAAGMAISNNYALQPVLPIVARDLSVSQETTGLIVGSLQIGYMAGILLLVPLGDKLKPATLVAWQFLLLGLALFLGAAAPSLDALLAAACLVGAMATNAVHLSGVAFRVSPPQTRGRAVGTVAMGISAGILLSRFVGGLIAQMSDWRVMLASFGVVAVVFGGLCWRLLPRHASQQSQEPYLRLLISLTDLPRQHPLLREGIAVGACWFFIFSALWVCLALGLAEPPLRLTPAQVGLFGFAGLLGLFATRPAGQFADRWGHRPVILGGFLLVVIGCLFLYVSSASIIGTAIGVALFDMGCFAAQVANQTRLLAIDAAARSRIYSVYMFTYYAAGAIGSVVGPMIFLRYGWSAMCELSIVLACFGFGLTLMNHRRARREDNRMPSLDDEAV
ncbi:Major facilitator superfamily MFS_1 [Thiomonas sp. X19]|uniref:Major facilitator superfamily MFS_1 n=2 Tax=Thiomonas TaxID=32012 RepID=D5X2I5_THIK1|nr:Major facilitator superfamily MFS_1 [Thiomonas sp. X19]